MQELFKRLAAHPLLTFELGVASLLAHLLGLASSLYVTQVLNRYVTSGVDATLVTMTVGVVLAILLEFGFRQARLRLAMSVGLSREKDLVAGTLGIMTTAKADALHAKPAAGRRETMRGLTAIHTAYAPANLTALLDVPFSLLHVAVLAVLSPTLGLITLLFMLALFILGLLNNRATRQTLHQLGELQTRKEAATHTLCSRIDTIRAFGADTWMRQRWQHLHAAAEIFQHRLENRQGLIQGIQGAIQALLSVVVIAVGAKLAIAGELQVGTLIGANILASRAMGPILRLVSLNELLLRAEHALGQLEQYAGLPVERHTGATLKNYQGGLELKEIAKTLFPAPLPLFESLNITLPAGAVLAISGGNGQAKTTLIRLLLGLTDPDRGQILADGVDIAQLHPAWWRRQIIHLPRDPEFLDGTIRDNLTLPDPDLTPERLNRALTDSGLGPWLDETPGGLETRLIDGGLHLPLELRKRLALARALTTSGKLALLDEPTEHLSAKGILTLYALLRQLSLQGTTLVVCTEDPNILRGASLLLDLSHAPKPQLINRLQTTALPGETA